MGGICQGSPTEMTSLLSPDQRALQQAMIGQVTPNIGKGATPYPGPVTSAPDPMQLMAANIMMGLQGGTYNAPAFLGAGGMQGVGGSPGPGPGPTKPYRDWSAPRTLPMKETGDSADIRQQRGYGVGPGWNTDMGIPDRQSIWPTGYDPLNDPTGWQRWLY